MAETSPLNDCWEMAQKYAESLGYVSGIFTSSIREIKTAEETAYNQQEQENLQELTITRAAFLIKVSPSLKAVFYFAAKTIYPKKLEQCSPVTVGKIVKLFKPGEVASIIALTYLFRAIQKKCDKQEWHVLEQKMKPHMEVGVIVGETITHVDSCHGMLLAGLQYLSMALLASEDLERFRDYRRNTAKKNLLFDLDKEKSIWGCNHLHIAALLAQAMGFGIDICKCFAALAGESVSTFPVEDKEAEKSTESHQLALEDKITCWKEALNWIDSFHRTGNPPEGTIIDKEESSLSVSGEMVKDLQDQVNKVLDLGTSYDWIRAKSGDLPPDIMEQFSVSLQLIEELQKMKPEDITKPKRILQDVAEAEAEAAVETAAVPEEEAP